MNNKAGRPKKNQIVIEPVKPVEEVNKVEPNIRGRIGKLKYCRITELAEQIGFDYRQLRTRISNVEKKHNVKILTKSDEGLSKTPLLVDMELFCEFFKQFTPPTSQLEKINILNERIKELELMVECMENLLKLAGIKK